MDVVDSITLDNFILSNESIREQELLLSGTIGEYYARLLAFYKTKKPKD